MATLLSTTATLSCATTNKISKLSVAKSLSTSRCSDVIGPLIVLDATSTFLATALRKLLPFDLAAVHIFQQNNPLVVSSSSAIASAYAGGDPGNTPDADDDGGEENGKQDSYDLPVDSECQDDDIEVEIENTGKNCRRIISKVAVQASLQTLWDILTDYERLADFIPGLAVSQLLDKRDNFARLFQIGEQNIAFGLKFNAKGTIDCFEKDLQTLPFGQKRDIEFKMVEGDFQLFEGKWSIEQGLKCCPEDLKRDYSVGQEFQTTLVYVVDVEPKLWLPVRLVEGRLCKEIRANLSCIRQEAEKAFKNANSAL